MGKESQKVIENIGKENHSVLEKSLQDLYQSLHLDDAYAPKKKQSIVSGSSPLMKKSCIEEIQEHQQKYEEDKKQDNNSCSSNGTEMMY